MPIHWIDNFAMRNFINDAVFDDTLPLEYGLLRLDSGFRSTGWGRRWRIGSGAKGI